jgi:hypothetical protein
MIVAIGIVERLLRQSDAWREAFKARGKQIEAAGASIRIKALQDVLDALKAEGR